jgi:hypothetical protein
MYEKDSIPKISFMFYDALKSATECRDLGYNKESFIKFCSNVWETMDLNHTKELEEALISGMQEDLEFWKLKVDILE